MNYASQLTQTPLPLFTQLAKVTAMVLKGIDEVRLFVGDPTEELMEGWPKEAEQHPLEFNTMTVEEEGEIKGIGPNAGGVDDIAKSIAQSTSLSLASPLIQRRPQSQMTQLLYASY